MPDFPRIEPEDILPEGSSKVALSPLQRVGVYGAISVGSVGAAVLIVLLIRWVLIAPQIPVLPSGVDANAAKVMLENYKALREAALDDTLRILDAFVAKLLLPIFTSFVGYVFGSQVSKEA
jgi:hypothetical protein